mgnify:CR=1 FL=1
MRKPKSLIEPIPVDVHLDSWFKAGNAGALGDLVNSQTHRMAEALLKEQARPSRATIGDAEKNSLTHSWYAGYCDAFRDLRRLCHTPKQLPREVFDTNEWTHIS